MAATVSKSATKVKIKMIVLFCIWCKKYIKKRANEHRGIAAGKECRFLGPGMTLEPKLWVPENPGCRTWKYIY